MHLELKQRAHRALQNLCISELIIIPNNGSFLTAAPPKIPKRNGKRTPS